MSEVIVRESEKNKLVQEITTGHHVLIADEPIEQGGSDEGPSPYDFLLAGLGACTAMTVRMYANFKKIPLEKIIVRLTYNKIHAQDCENCDSSDAKLDHIDRVIELIGDDLTLEQRDKLLAIANKCPVHKTLTSKIDITTELLPNNKD